MAKTLISLLILAFSFYHVGAQVNKSLVGSRFSISEGASDAILSRIDAIVNELSMLNDDMTELSQDLKTLQDQLKSAKNPTEQSTIQDKIAALQKKIQSLQAKMAAKQNELAKLQAQLAKAQSAQHAKIADAYKSKSMTTEGGYLLSAVLSLPSAAPKGGVQITLSSKDRSVQLLRRLTIPAGKKAVKLLIPTRPVRAIKSVPIQVEMKTQNHRERREFMIVLK